MSDAEWKPCRRCECNHDGSVPGFPEGECNCHRIGGSYITEMIHDYEPVEDEDEG